ncbi:hypothetical protein [Isoptericola sp. NPDC056134]|uniref:hypothetical protein n=1 Tax=Isoptericola sp. NPDC056134 TaxID=3345723 RepID=UPI0035EA1B7B
MNKARQDGTLDIEEQALVRSMPEEGKDGDFHGGQMNVAQSQVSPWAARRFGSAAAELLDAVPAAIVNAHEQAEAAHDAGGLATNDAYGVTMMVAMHDCLVRATSSIPGVVARKPGGVRSRFSYVVIEETAVALVPWRFGADASVRRQDATLRRPVSDLRQAFFSLSANSGHIQPTLDEMAGDAVEIQAALEEEEAAFTQLTELGAIVTVAFASNPRNGIIELGWGDAELEDVESGAVAWHHWERLSPTVGARRPVALTAPHVADSEPASRFDQLPSDDEFTVTPRRSTEEAPMSESALTPGEDGENETVGG